MYPELELLVEVACKADAQDVELVGDLATGRACHSQGRGWHNREKQCTVLETHQRGVCALHPAREEQLRLGATASFRRRGYARVIIVLSICLQRFSLLPWDGPKRAGTPRGFPS